MIKILQAVSKKLFTIRAVSVNHKNTSLRDFYGFSIRGQIWSGFSGTDVQLVYTALK